MPLTIEPARQLGAQQLFRVHSLGIDLGVAGARECRPCGVLLAGSSVPAAPLNELGYRGSQLAARWSCGLNVSMVTSNLNGGTIGRARLAVGVSPTTGGRALNHADEIRRFGACSLPSVPGLRLGSTTPSKIKVYGRRGLAASPPSWLRMCGWSRIRSMKQGYN